MLSASQCESKVNNNLPNVQDKQVHNSIVTQGDNLQNIY